MGLEYRVNKRGYHLYNTYVGIYGNIMFNPKFKYVNNNLLRRYITHIYVKLITGGYSK